MLPVVRGDAETKRQVLLWSVVMTAVSLLPVASGAASAFYFVSALVLGGIFCALSWLLWRGEGLAWTKATFHYSLLYLALLFVALAVDAASL
jgi:protoheme IX farnesyltransferase